MVKKIFFFISLLLIINPITFASTQGIDLSITIVNESFNETSSSDEGRSSGGGSGGPSGGGGSKLPTIIEKKCRERWICTDWSECISEPNGSDTSIGIQNMDCYDYNNCGTFEVMPPLERTCGIEIPIEEEKPRETEGDRKIFPSLFIISIIIIYILLSESKNRMKKRKKR